jgi:hypothetical protein
MTHTYTGSNQKSISGCTLLVETDEDWYYLFCDAGWQGSIGIGLGLGDLLDTHEAWHREHEGPRRYTQQFNSMLEDGWVNNAPKKTPFIYTWANLDKAIEETVKRGQRDRWRIVVEGTGEVVWTGVDGKVG